MGDTEAVIKFINVELTIAPQTPTTIDKSIFYDVTFTRALKLPSQPSSAPSAPEPAVLDQEVIRDTLRYPLGRDLKGQVTINDVLDNSSVLLALVGLDGRSLDVNQAFDVVANPNEPGLFRRVVNLTQTDVQSLQREDRLPDGIITPILRPAAFVSTSAEGRSIEYSSAQLLVAPAPLNKPDDWQTYRFQAIFELSKGIETVSRYLKDPIPAQIQGLDWSFAHLAVDGSFTVRFPTPPKDGWKAWVWLLSGNSLQAPILGVVYETVTESTGRVRSIFLPPIQHEHDRKEELEDDENAQLAAECHCGDMKRVPATVSEAELAGNPQVYTEDPGAFCKPFSNPARVVSERSFFSIVRTEQPVISAEASIKLREPAQLDFDPPEEMLQGINGEAENRNGIPPVMLSSIGASTTGAALDPRFFRESRFSPINGSILRARIRDGISVVKDNLPSELVNEISSLNRGRRDLEASFPVQWDSESIRYQATTVARGHILEFRIRTRSNGYSLGGVAKTMTLAPRQTKRIQKVEWQRSEFATRAEEQEGSNTVNDSTLNDASYQNAVAANLNEWSKGSSSSRVTAVAAGVGAVLGPVAIGGGAAHATARSQSEQEGGRDVTAKEEMQWRGAIRRHGDDLRKLESTVVMEATQKEEVTGTVELIQNKNYAHSLSVIYHNILRHLRVDTEFGGARECLFVPFAMKPFTMQRAYRWREAIRGVLQERRFHHPMRYLKDILTGFKYSKIPPGRRADHPIRALYGSIYINMGIARPGDTDKGEYNPDAWKVLSPFLLMPALSIHQEIRQQAENIFQRRYAPGVAAKWCNLLEIETDNGAKLSADFTLATSYTFNQTIRVDFQVKDLSYLTRAAITGLTVRAKSALVPGSMANLRSMNYTYQTDYETNSTYLNQGVGDLVIPDTGEVDREGANLKAQLTPRELQNLRADLVYDTLELLQHLNEHIEYYHRMIWWTMDRDRLFMLLDGFFVPGMEPKTSLASVVERNPIGMAGNSLIFRVSAGCFVGTTLGNAVLDTPEKLDNWYQSRGTGSAPMHISLPTDGLYAQTIMDECVALEEHYGTIDWALNDPDPELGSLDASLLESRRSDTTTAVQPSQMPETLISLQNATPAPAPQGLAGVLGAAQNANAFRDMAGLAGTQGLAGKGLETAAALATSLSGQAGAAVKLADLANKQAAVTDIDKKLASIEKAKNKGLAPEGDLTQHTNDALAQMNGPSPPTSADVSRTTPKEAKEAIKCIEEQVKKKHIPKEEGKKRISEQIGSMKGSKPKIGLFRGITIRLIGHGGSALQGLWTWELTQRQIQMDPEPKIVDVHLDGDSTPSMNTSGRLNADFTQELGAAGESFDFHLMGEIFGTNLLSTPVPGSGLSVDKIIHFMVPKHATIATATITAVEEVQEVQNKKGKEAGEEWRVGAGLEVEGGFKLLARIMGSLSGDRTTSNIDSVEEVQNWKFYYYTGGFNEGVKID